MILDEFKPLEFFLLCSLEDEEIDREKKVEKRRLSTSIYPRLAARGLSGVLLCVLKASRRGIDGCQ